MFIPDPDPGSDFFPSRIRIVSIPDPNHFHPGSRIRIKELSILTKKIVSNSVADPGSGAILTPGSGMGFFRISDP
jgi:hypothetical protein